MFNSRVQLAAPAPQSTAPSDVAQGLCPGAPTLATECEWYALQTRPRHEKRVAQEVRARSIEEFLPLHRCRNKWKNGVVADVELPLFPCYLFAKVPLRDRVRLLQLPGVIGFAVNSSRPTALAERDIDALRTLNLMSNAEPHPFLKVGDRVRIIDGPLSGMEGILSRRKHELRVVLSLDFIMRSVAVEVGEFDIEPIGRKSAAWQASINRA